MKRMERCYGSDFVEALASESMEKFGRLLEETTPRPDLLSISVRNQVYGMISNLLFMDKHIERSLIYILELVKNNDSLSEIYRHNTRNIYEALDRTSKEPSKRGLLASLLKSRIKNKLN